MRPPESVTGDGGESSINQHSFLTHLVAAGDRLADMLVDVSAIGVIGYMAISGVATETGQVLGAMVTTIAIGKRYYQSKQNTASTQQN